jgi:molybdopterin molybdotransferase
MSMQTLQQVASCLSDYDPNALPVATAQQFIAQFVPKINSVEKVAIRSTLSRVLAQDIISRINVPAHDNSAMDGYAFDGAQLQGHGKGGDVSLQVIGTAYAGVAFDGSVAHGQCVRIMTGAVMPAGCDTVVPQEFVKNEEHRIQFAASILKRGDNRRCKGEDLAAGQAALAAGRRITPADLGLLASLGVAEVPVKRRLRVAFFSTGDELRSIGEPLDAGCVYDSNRYTLYGMLKRLDADIIDMGVVKDEPTALEAAMRSACENADAIITSGGVSVGEADFTKQMMARLGDVAFWTIAMRPGRPMAFGRINSNGKSAVLFGLPGNPVAVMVTFYFFVRHGLAAMLGNTGAQPLLLKASSETALRKKPGRTEYQRGIATRHAGGTVTVRITGSQGSGVLRSMSEANCFVVLAHDGGSVNEGDAVDILPFDGLI